MSGVCDPGMLKWLTPSPALIATTASSPVVHCILPCAYRNITNDSSPLVARTHWNVLVYNIHVQKKQ